MLVSMNVPCLRSQKWAPVCIYMLSVSVQNNILLNCQQLTHNTHFFTEIETCFEFSLSHSLTTTTTTSEQPVPRTELSGDSDRYVKTGSTVHLQCTIYGAIEPPTYIMWYHDAQPIHADNKLGYKMHLIKSNVQRISNDAAIKYELNDLVQTPFDDTLQRRQNSVSMRFILWDVCVSTKYTSIQIYFNRLDHCSSNPHENIIREIIHAIHRIVLRPPFFFLQRMVCISTRIFSLLFLSSLSGESSASPVKSSASRQRQRSHSLYAFSAMEIFVAIFLPLVLRRTWFQCHEKNIPNLEFQWK